MTLLLPRWLGANNEFLPTIDTPRQNRCRQFWPEISYQSHHSTTTIRSWSTRWRQLSLIFWCNSHVIATVTRSAGTRVCTAVLSSTTPLNVRPACRNVSTHINRQSWEDQSQRFGRILSR